MPSRDGDFEAADLPPVSGDRSQGKLKGRQPKLTPKQQRELKRMHETGEYTISDLGELFSVSRPTVYRTIKRTTAART